MNTNVEYQPQKLCCLVCGNDNTSLIGHYGQWHCFPCTKTREGGRGMGEYYKENYDKALKAQRQNEWTITIVVCLLLVVAVVLEFIF